MRRFLFLLALLFIFVPPALASDGSEVPGWEQVLFQFSRPSGIAVGVGVALSYIADYIPQYKSLAKKQKRLVFLGVSLLVPLTASLLGSLTANWPWSWDQVYWPALASGLLTFGSGTVAHVRALGDS